MILSAAGGSRYRPVVRLALISLTVILGVGGCTLFTKEKLACPAAAVVAGTGTLTQFGDGLGRDAGDVAYQAEISNLAILCRKASGGIETTVTFEISAHSGPADRTGGATMPFFVAVSLGSERILNKRVFTSEHYFPVQTGNSVFREEVVELVPIFEGRTAADYEILIGFQLSPEQLEYNVLH